MSATVDRALHFKFTVASIDPAARCVVCEELVHQGQHRRLWTLTLAAGDETVAVVCDRCAAEYRVRS